MTCGGADLWEYDPRCTERLNITSLLLLLLV